MPLIKPYQPVFLRILHSANGVLVFAAVPAELRFALIASGFLIYNTFDYRFGKLPLSRIDTIISIHANLGWGLFAIVLAFALYGLAFGNKRLIQRNSLEKLTKVGKPIWWYTLHRLVNTVLLLAPLVAISAKRNSAGTATGNRTQADWLLSGDLLHPIYSLHLLAWATIVIALVLHVLMGLKVGGVPLLLLSIVDWRIRSNDLIKQWFKQRRD
ncbi:MAG: cytochrome b/b6 domain-containing protein [Myxacorys californica WJT36-NPBG1]|jgi:thiosulfate reductase cytochrome b subunit|nr:cytochrome b/b6 domain-containing protein [Myxacorys californica WJT36-NPBG1]